MLFSLVGAQGPWFGPARFFVLSGVVRGGLTIPEGVLGSSVGFPHLRLERDRFSSLSGEELVSEPLLWYKGNVIRSLSLKLLGIEALKALYFPKKRFKKSTCRHLYSEILSLC